MVNLNNKGFIATSLIYSFFLVFLALLAVILNSYVFNNRLMDAFNKSIQNKINKEIDMNSDDPSYILEDLEVLHITPNLNTPNFNNIATSDKGVFVSTDNKGKSYYYRGDVDDNYIIFGEHPDYEHVPLYWRIIRMNGDGSLRLIYEGYKVKNNLITDPYSTNRWSTVSTATDYINSFEGSLKSFYEKFFLRTRFESMISDSGFCSTITSTVQNPSSCTKTDGKIMCLGEEKSITEFSDYDRIYTFKNSPVGISPSYLCKEENQYSVALQNGNGTLSYPIGLVSSNEVIMAGGAYAPSSAQNLESYSNQDFYLYKGIGYWTMSLYYDNQPSGGDISTMSINFLSNKIGGGDAGTNESGNRAFGFTQDGYLNSNTLDGLQLGIYPVINIKEEYISTLTGDGTIIDPFIGELNEE